MHCNTAILQTSMTERALSFHKYHFLSSEGKCHLSVAYRMSRKDTMETSETETLRVTTESYKYSVHLSSLCPSYFRITSGISRRYEGLQNSSGEEPACIARKEPTSCPPFSYCQKGKLACLDLLVVMLTRLSVSSDLLYTQCFSIICVFQ